MINNEVLVIIIVIYFLFLLLTKNKKKGVINNSENKNTVYVVLRVKDNNLDNTEQFLRSFQKQNLKNKKLIIMNDQSEFEKYFIIYCDNNNNTDLYSSKKLDESTFNLILKDLKLERNQIVLTCENNDYFKDNNILTLIKNNKIKSFHQSKLSDNQPKYYYYQKN